MNQNEENATGTYSPQQVAADLFRIGENPSLPAWQYPVLRQAIELLGAPVEREALSKLRADMFDWLASCTKEHIDGKIEFINRVSDGFAAIYACASSPTAPISSDWKLMPPKLTPKMREAMVTAAREYQDRTEGNSPDAMYEAVFAAVPPNAADEQASFDYDDVVSVCDAHGICLPVDYVDMVVDIVKLSGLLAARRAFANEPSAEVFTYATKQATACASCGEYKHTPLRIERMGGYVCLTCIDHELERSVALADDQRAAIEFALGACAGHVAGERHVPALESLLSVAQEAR
ncbi:gp38 [Burkholderia aenigmatica]|uniref:Gp38 n=1 Tax=Burkholderia aenigmatica TaxID=2015348 RepID=A0ABY6XWN8_9BURK|nr:hypothetical protein [Burkholderia aenigmatica]VWC95845.1 gp38 [Burkholderia aenigmatica]